MPPVRGLCRSSRGAQPVTTTHTGRPAANELQAKGEAARRAARELARASTAVKNRALQAVADALLDRADAILEANATDVAGAEKAGLAPALIDRLKLNIDKLQGIAGDTRDVAALPDPVGEMTEARTLPNGLRSEEHTSELQSPTNLVCRLLLEKK